MTLSNTAQILNPVKWSYDSKQISEDVFELNFTASLEEHWHIYSTTLSGDEGPVPTSFDFKPGDGYELIDGIKEPKPIKEFDKNFEMNLLFFDREATFTQQVRLLKPSVTVTGELTYMVCDDSKCLPPDYIDFSFDLTKKSGESNEPVNEEKTEAKPSLGEAQPLIANNNKPEIFNPVKWDFSSVRISDTEYEIVLDATIDKGWHLYSQNLESQDGPVATEVNLFNPDSNFVLIGDAKEEGDLIKEYDKNFMMELSFYANDVTFRQRIKTEGASSIKGEVYFMVCDDSKCLPPEAIEFELDLSKSEIAAENTSSNDDPEKTSYWLILLYSFLGGMAALLTPCVFPMIPMTVSFFTKQSKTKAEGVRKGVTYGLSIVFIYVLCSVPFHLFDTVSPDIFNEMATNPYLNLFFFAVFIVFAVSFLGAFELTLPSSWVNKADANADKGGLIGIFFMALTLILVSFSCTGPALGLLLGSVLSTTGGAMYLTVGLLGFGLGLGLPFGLFAAFPGWMNSLPQSGGWLNSVKVVFGFVELAFAFKFLSNADLVTQSGLLTRELFIAIWIAISATLTLYLLGFIRLPHDSQVERLSVGRTLLATLTFTFTLYLVPGLWGAPLKMIAGFPPPMFYSESPNGVGKAETFIASAGNTTHSKKSSHASCPHNLNCFHDYEEGLAYAKEVGKPVMLDFTGWACVNCRKMEEQVWSEAPVLNRLRDDVVLISLYVDEKAKLPENEQYVSETTGKKIKTVGNRWSEFQIKNYQSNTQPYYILIDHNEKQLVESASYDPDVEKFVDWLDRGVGKFNKTK